LRVHHGNGVVGKRVRVVHLNKSLSFFKAADFSSAAEVSAVLPKEK
jgi:hypothetical protein